jgi:hypothetical protein
LKATKHLSPTHLNDNTTLAQVLLHSPADLWLSSGTENPLNTKLHMDELYQIHPTDNYLIPIDQDRLSTAAYRLSNRIDEGTVVYSPRLLALLEGPHHHQEDSLSTVFFAKTLKASHSGSYH